MNGGSNEALASTVHYDLISIREYGIVSARKLPRLGGGK